MATGRIIDVRLLTGGEEVHHSGHHGVLDTVGAVG